MLISNEYLIFRDLFDLRVDTVEIDGIVELIFKEIILDRHLAAAVYEMACILTCRPAIITIGSIRLFILFIDGVFIFCLPIFLIKWILLFYAEKLNYITYNCL